MFKTKLFSNIYALNSSSVDTQINRWIDKHPNIVLKDIKFQTTCIDDDQVMFSALVIYEEL